MRVVSRVCGLHKFVGREPKLPPIKVLRSLTLANRSRKPPVGEPK